MHDRECCGRFITTRPLNLDETLSFISDIRLQTSFFFPGKEKVKE